MQLQRNHSAGGYQLAAESIAGQAGQTARSASDSPKADGSRQSGQGTGQYLNEKRELSGS